MTTKRLVSIPVMTALSRVSPPLPKLLMSGKTWVTTTDGQLGKGLLKKPIS